MRRAASYILIFFLGYCLCGKAFAQDPHFSQYFSSPLTFNPAFTGYFSGQSRLTFNIRNQWANIGDPYTTGTASFDTKILQNKISGSDKWGIGVLGLYDQSGGGIFKNNYISISTGFNKGLDADGDQSIGIGVQVGFARNSVDFSRISFNNQFTSGGYDLSIPSGETVNNQSVSYTDVNAGVLYNYKDESDNQYSIGASMFHILRPKLSFFSGNNNSLQRRYTLHAGANLNMAAQDQLFVSAHLMRQSGASEIVIGGAYGLSLGESDMSLYMGAWLRVKDAVYPYVGLRSSVYQVGLSYDITSSDLTRVKGFTGSSELSFIYFFNKETRKGISCFF